MVKLSLAQTLRYYRAKLRNLRVIDQRELYAVWEQQQLRSLFRHLEVDAVFDVGANAGQYAKMLREQLHYDGLIFSFEPSPEVAARAALAAQGDDKWVVHALALSDSGGTQSFNVMAESQFSSFSRPLPSQDANVDRMNTITGTIEVPTETLADAYLRLRDRYDFKRPFLKLDTQGFDVRIVESGRSVMPGFVGLQSELAISRLYDDAIDFRSALSRYESMGFTLSALVPNNAGHFPRLLEIDCIMLRTDLALLGAR